jgi:hypothetical protein
MIFRVAVGVALERPPRIDEFRLVVVDAPDAADARLAASQMAAATSVMPVWTGRPDDVLDVPAGWLR